MISELSTGVQALQARIEYLERELDAARQEATNCKEQAAQNARLREALQTITSEAHQCDSWEYFPSEPIEVAERTLSESMAVSLAEIEAAAIERFGAWIDDDCPGDWFLYTRRALATHYIDHYIRQSAKKAGGNHDQR